MATLDSVQSPGISVEVDPAFRAERVSLRPTDYTNQSGAAYGHYRAGTLLGAAIAPTASAYLFNLRFAPSTGFAVVYRVTWAINVVTAVTAQSTPQFGLFFARNYTVQETTQFTAVSFVNKLRTSMSSASATLGVTGNTAGMSGGTRTIDAQPLGYDSVVRWGQPLVAVGTGSAGVLFECTAAGQHPIVLQPQEGLLVQWGSTTLGTGTINMAVNWEWAEVPSF